jgi:hypothetical protein
VTVVDAPGAIVAVDGETAPNEMNRSVTACQLTVPVKPSSAPVTSLTIAVQVPAAGVRTSALP